MKSKQTKPKQRKPRRSAAARLVKLLSEPPILEQAPAPAPRSEIAQNIEALNSAIEGLGTIRDAIGSYRARGRELEVISARFDLLV